MTTTTIASHARGYRVRKPNRRRGSIGAAVTLARRAAITLLAAFFAGAVFPQLAAPVANAATRQPMITVSAGIIHNTRPAITVTMLHAPACVTDPTVVALHDGAYVFWGYQGTIRRGHPVRMTLELDPGTRGTWRIVNVDGMPCGNPDGQFSWPVNVTVRL